MKLFRIKINDRTFAVRANNQLEAGFKLKKALRDASVKDSDTYEVKLYKIFEDKSILKFSSSKGDEKTVMKETKDYLDRNPEAVYIRIYKNGSQQNSSGEAHKWMSHFGKKYLSDSGSRISDSKIEDSSSKLRDVALNMTVQCYIFSGDKVLIQDRIGPAWKGLAVPGGHVKNGESVENACIRETFEETGLKVRDLELFGTHQYTCEEDGESIALLYKTSSFEGELRGSEEGKVFWMPIKEVLDSDKCAEGFKELLSKAAGIEAESAEIEDDRLAPMTYKKLKEFGYTSDDWGDWTQEQANEVVRKHSEGQGEQAESGSEEEVSESEEVVEEEGQNSGGDNGSEEEKKEVSKEVPEASKQEEPKFEGVKSAIAKKVDGSFKKINEFDEAKDLKEGDSLYVRSPFGKNIDSMLKKGELYEADTLMFGYDLIDSLRKSGLVDTSGTYRDSIEDAERLGIYQNSGRLGGFFTKHGCLMRYDGLNEQGIPMFNGIPIKPNIDRNNNLLVFRELIDYSDPKEQETARLMGGSEHAEMNGRYYNYVTVNHPKLGEFTISVSPYGRNTDVRTDGKPWNFLQKDEYKLTEEQKKWVEENADRISGGRQSLRPKERKIESYSGSEKENISKVFSKKDEISGNISKMMPRVSGTASSETGGKNRSRNVEIKEDGTIEIEYNSNSYNWEPSFKSLAKTALDYLKENYGISGNLKAKSILSGNKLYIYPDYGGAEE